MGRKPTDFGRYYHVPTCKKNCTPIPDLESFGLLSGQLSLQRQQKVQHANVSVLRLHDGHRLIS